MTGSIRAVYRRIVKMVHIVEALVALVIIICAADGWRRGLLLKAFGLVRFIVMIVLTVVLTPVTYQILKLRPGIREGMAVLLSLVLAAVLLFVLSKVLRIVDHIPVLKTINHLGGAVLGLIFGVLAVWVVLVLLAAFTDIEWCKNVTGYVNDSPVLSKLVRFNPVSLLK